MCFLIMKSRCDVNIATSSMSPAGYGLSLHTDQQNLILGEMINTRNRLQEENQELRDSLQDAEMVIRLLHMKLEKERAANRQKKEKPSKEKDRKDCSESPLRTKNFDWRSKRVIGKAKAYNKQAFLNVVAPGKRTFEPPTTNSKVIKPTSIHDLTQERGIPSPRRHRPAESPSRQRPKPAGKTSAKSPSPSHRSARVKQESAPSKTAPASPTPIHRGTRVEQESPSKTAIGRIVDEVIQEYSGR